MATTWLHTALLPARSVIGRRRARGWGGDANEPPPLRAELFTADQMEIGPLDDDTEPMSIELDGEVQDSPALALRDDGRLHQVRVRTVRSRRAAAVEGALE